MAILAKGLEELTQHQHILHTRLRPSLTMASPADKRKIVKKRMKKFPRFQADRFKRMNPAWRKL